MSKHKHHHILPAAYLSGFIAFEPPPEHKNKPKFELGVYTNDEKLSAEWKMKGVRHKDFTRYKYYNLPDQGNELAVEHFLGEKEGEYAELLRSIESHRKLTKREIKGLAIFITTMIIRVESFQSHYQEFVNEIVSSIEAFMGDTPKFRSFIGDYENTTKRLIQKSDAGSTLLNHGLHFIVNTTDMPFITTDKPVLRKDCHSDELPLLVGAGSHCKQGIKPNQIHPMFYIPVTSVLAIVCCKLIEESYPDSPYITCSDINAVFRLNRLMLVQAQELVIADRPFPFGTIEAEISQELQQDHRVNGMLIKLYTDQNRYVLEVSDFKEIVDGIELRFVDTEDLKKILTESPVSFELYKNGRSFRGMREIEWGDSTDNRIQIVQKLKFGITLTNNMQF